MRERILHLQKHLPRRKHKIWAREGSSLVMAFHAFTAFTNWSLGDHSERKKIGSLQEFFFIEIEIVTYRVFSILLRISSIKFPKKFHGDIILVSP